MENDLITRVWAKIRWYEKGTAGAGAAVLLLSLLTWWYGEHTLEWAVKIAEPMFLAIGSFSIVLLWAQLRAADAQEREQNIWKRVVCFHEHFDDVPRTDRAEDVRKYLLELGVVRPPSAYAPLTPAQAAAIFQDEGAPARAPAKVLVAKYLNDWEGFCGAIGVGVVDDDYAREIEGTRLIDTFFGYREAINLFRESHATPPKGNDGSTVTPPFAHKSYAELQVVALRWYDIRVKEAKDQEERLLAANLQADRLRDEARKAAGVTPKAKRPT